MSETTTPTYPGPDASPLDYIVYDTERKFAQKSADLKSAAEYMIRKLERVIREIDADYHVNSLGELQGSAPQFDILCAERENLANTLVALKWAQEKANGTAD